MADDAVKLATEIRDELLGINNRAYIDDDDQAQDAAGLNGRLSTIYSSSSDAAGRADRLLALLDDMEERWQQSEDGLRAENGRLVAERDEANRQLNEVEAERDKLRALLPGGKRST